MNVVPHQIRKSNKHSIFVLFLLLVISSLSLPAAGGSDADHHDNHDEGAEMILPDINPADLEGRRLKVVASTGFIGDVLSNIAGEQVEVTVLMSGGQNPHSWEPSPGNIASIENADLVFVNGLGLEAELLNIIEAMDGVIPVQVSAGVEVLEGEFRDSHDHDAGDPHVWFSPVNVMKWTENMETVLSAADPSGKKQYEIGADIYLAELNKLDTEVRTALSVLEPEEKKLVTDHTSIDYYAREYGFEVLGRVIPSTSDQAEPSARDIAALTDLVEAEEIKTIFVGDTAGRGLKQLVQSVALESGRDVKVVELLTGSLASEGERGSTYLDFIRYNTEIIIGALAVE